jgi:hypothetical protein
MTELTNAAGGHAALLAGNDLTSKIGDLQVAIVQTETAERSLRAEIDRLRESRKIFKKELVWAKARKRVLQNAALRLQQLDEGL